MLILIEVIVTSGLFFKMIFTNPLWFSFIFMNIYVQLQIRTILVKSEIIYNKIIFISHSQNSYSKKKKYLKQMKDDNARSKIKNIELYNVSYSKSDEESIGVIRFYQNLLFSVLN